MKKTLPAVLAALLLGVGVWAQNTVDQGQPGTQGPWPVTSSGGTVTVVNDGGFSGTVAPQPCNILLSTNTSVGTSAVPVPTTPLASRIWVQVCNSVLNSGSTQCICAGNTCPASVAAASVGDALNPSDCALYPIGTQDAGVPCCICNGAGSRMTATECSL